MKKLFKYLKFFSTVNKTPTEKAMAKSSRYFQNNLVDFEEGQQVFVPEGTVESAIFNVLDSIDANFEPNEQNAEDGIYLGTAGVSYMYYHLSKNVHLSQHRSKFLLKAEEYLKPALHVLAKNPRVNDIPGFILGHCGVYAIAAAFYNAVGNHELSARYRNSFYNAAETCKEQHFLRCGSDELFVGRAGYVLGALWMATETSTPIKSKDLFDICNVIVASGKEYSRNMKSSSPLMYSYYDVEYLGAAHGLCSILQVLLSVPGYTEAHPKESKYIQESVDYLLNLQDSEGNFPCATDEIKRGRNDLVHWCHGAPGVIYMLAKAYLKWNDEKYLKACHKAAEVVWRKGLLRKGPGICHGIAGNGYVFLLMFRLTGDNKYLYRAIAFAKFMESDEFKREARVPDNPYSLYEGIAGTACFLSDLLLPERASFPFSDVF